MVIEHTCTAGATLRLEFPELPETLYALTRREEKPVACLQACLPANYTPEREFPLWLHIQGGAGPQGGAWEIEYVRRLTEDRDFIGVSLPLFKNTLDPWEVHGGLLIQAYDDYPLIAECYRAMLSRLFAVAPNVARGRGVMGGFSNGGHITALLLSAVDPFILEHFNSFYFLDGGFEVASWHKRQVAEKDILYMVGGSRKEGWRRLMLRNLNATAKQAKKQGRSFKLVKMAGVEHAFPDEYIPTLRRWVRKMMRGKE